MTGVLSDWRRRHGLLHTVLLVVMAPAWMLHELTHAGAAAACGAGVRFRVDPWPLVELDWPPDVSRLVVRVVHLAPTVTGVVVGVWYVLRVGVPSVSPVTLVFVAWYAGYTYPSPDDRRPSLAVTE